VSVLIPGAKDEEQVRGNVSASDLPPLGPALHERLRRWYEAEVAGKIRGPY
jgi:aryl-alcohol dehydrogenase-like predicted oxidoreductase